MLQVVGWTRLNRSHKIYINKYFEEEIESQNDYEEIYSDAESTKSAIQFALDILRSSEAQDMKNQLLQMFHEPEYGKQKDLQR